MRIIAATNKDLDVEIEEGRFRRDLYYRLNISSVFIPPLRERKGDVELLSYYFLDKYCRANGKEIHSIAEPVMELLEGYDFPGNVRELENIIASAVVLETGDALGLNVPAALPAQGGGGARRARSRGRRAGRSPTWRPSTSATVLAHTAGNRTAAARILGISQGGPARQAEAARHRRRSRPGASPRHTPPTVSLTACSRVRERRSRTVAWPGRDPAAARSRLRPIVT